MTIEGCYGCIYGDWDANGCTCMETGLLIGNAAEGCDKRHPPQEKKMTNADRIRQMTDEELAKIIRSCKFCAYLNKGCQHNGTCTQGFLEWLKQEVSEDAGSKTN